MDASGSAETPPKHGTPGGGKSGKGQSTPMAEQPCKFFRSDTGCKAGKSCKWSHSWDGVEDKNNRCWICGSKEHRKSDCKVKGSGKPASGEPGLGGGRGGQNAAKAAVKQVAVSGNKGAEASTTSTTDATLSQTSTEAAGPGAESNSHGASFTATMEVEKGGASAAGPGTSEFLAEATQLLKFVRMPMPTIKAMRLDDVNPTMKVMHLSKLEPNAQVLLDPGGIGLQ